MKVLWVSARIFEEAGEKQSSVWHKAIATRLAEQEGIILGNISYQSKYRNLTHTVYRNIQQWGTPKKGKTKKGISPAYVCMQFKNVVEVFKIDIIQVWGSENPFKLLPFSFGFKVAKILTMQGVLNSIWDHILNGLTVKEIILTIGLRELITNNSLLSTRRSFQKLGAIERLVL